MTDGNWRSGFLAMIASTLIAGCLPEARDVNASAPAEALLNSPPGISGSPTAKAVVGTRWQFQPSASDPDGDPLHFGATGLPGWAGIDPGSGLVSGTPRPEDAGTDSTIVVTVSDGEHAVSLQAFQVTVIAATPSPAPANTPPTISGSPPSVVEENSRYSFIPSASDAETPLQSLRFSIANLPSWAAFNSLTGALTGTPGPEDEGTFRDIVISVRDGEGATASLPAFTITVRPPPGNGTAILRWMPPTEYTDGSSLSSTQLDSFRIYHGISSGALSPMAEVDSRTTSFTVENLRTGTHYFAVTAVSSAGLESDFSEVGTKTLP